MKIIQIINYPGQGGAEQYAYLLAKEAKKAGHETLFVFGGEGPMVKRVAELGLDYKFVKMRAPYDPLAVYSLVKVFKDFQPDVIQTHYMRENFLAIDAALIAKVRGVFSTVHRLEPKTQAQALVNRFYSKGLRSFIAISDLARDYLLDEGIHKYRAVVILNGAEVGKINKSKIRKDLGIKDSEKMVSYVGRFTEEKGHEGLIKAFIKADIPNTKLVLTGEGELLPKMKKLAQPAGDGIIFTGGVENGFEIAGASDLYVQPSKIENMPLSVIEAMLYGVPILASDIPAHRIILKDGKFGNYFKYNKVQDLSKAISEAVESVELQKKSKLAKEYANERYTAEKMWQETEKLYRKYI